MKKILLLIVILILSFLSLKYIFVISKIECSIYSSHELKMCPTEEVKLLESLIGYSLFFTDIETLLLEKNNNLLPFQIVAIQKKLPNSIHFTLRYDSPVYALQLSSQIVGVSSRGTIVPLKDAQTLPLVTHINPDTLKIKNQIEGTFHSNVSDIFAYLSTYEKPVRVQYVSPQEIILYFSDSPRYIINAPIQETLATQIKTIQKSEELQSLEITINEVDLRFDLPVLRTTQ